MSGQDHQSASSSFQWSSNNAQHQQQHQQQQQQSQGGQLGEGSSYRDNSFSPTHYYNSDQSDAEINAILAGTYDSSSFFSGQSMQNIMPTTSSSMGPSSQPMLNSNFQHGSQSSNSSKSNNSALGGITSEHLDNATAAAAAAAYGHLGYGGMTSLEQIGMASGRNDFKGYSDTTSSISGAGLDFQRSNRGNGGAGYEGDASNTSSSQTPGALSSGDDSSSGKRRRTTVGGGLASVNQQERFEAGLSTGGLDGRGASASQAMGGSRPVMQHHGTSSVDSRSLEKMAQESLQRASQDNARALHTNAKAHPNRPQLGRPPFRQQRKSICESYPGIEQSSSNSTVTAQTIDTLPTPNKRYSGGSFIAPPQPSPIDNSMLGGHAASHPPGLGTQILRGVDASANGMNAATDFTKRKGWPTRIVEELLDFVHVLDRQGRVLFASPSILTLTGWRAEELRGKELTDFVHPDDVAAVRREFQTSLHRRSELTMYYRFQRKPKTAADKQRVRDQREAQHVSRSRSGSTSGGDTSSNQDVVSTHNRSSTLASGSMDNQFGASRHRDISDEGDLQDDSRDKYVIFEATGHPYISPVGSFPDSSEWNDEHVEKILPDVVASTRAGKKQSIKTEFAASATLEEKPRTADEIQCFFCSCRIYPTKNVGMLDSFLELKLENERLRMLLSELSVTDGAQNVADSGIDATSDGRRSLDEQVGYPFEYPLDNEQQLMNQRNRTNQNQNTGLSNRFGIMRNDSWISSGSGGNSNPVSPSIGQAMDSAATMTSASGQGAVDESDDETSPNPASTSPDEKEKKKKKKPKQEEEDYVCTDCGRVDSPEWRKGPLGPKTLCNACGLRWAKKIKRSGGDPNAIAMAARPAKGQIKAQAAAARAQKQNMQYEEENGDATQSGPPPLHPGTSNIASYTSQQQQQSQQSPPTFLSEESFNNLYGDATWNQMSNNSDSLQFDSSMQQHMSHNDYSQAGGV
jgi:PAS domain-containing protein